MSSSRDWHFMSWFPELTQGGLIASDRACIQDMSRPKPLNEQLLLKGMKIIQIMIMRLKHDDTSENDNFKITSKLFFFPLSLSEVRERCRAGISRADVPVLIYLQWGNIKVSALKMSLLQQDVLSRIRGPKAPSLAAWWMEVYYLVYATWQKASAGRWSARFML